MDRTQRRRVSTRLFLLLAFACAAPLASHARIDAWPLLEVDDDTTTVLYPLYVNDGDFQMVFPVLASRQ